jgi:hypothetical protein
LKLLWIVVGFCGSVSDLRLMLVVVVCGGSIDFGGSVVGGVGSSGTGDFLITSGNSSLTTKSKSSNWLNIRSLSFPTLLLLEIDKKNLKRLLFLKN